jgi:NAD(P)-dependent dehydrogenase (short-subunit alcohol dehydrogenase family)
MTSEKFLSGKTALITGASRGLGASLAKKIGAAGAHSILVARTIGGLEECDDAIQKSGGTSTLVPLDLMELEKIDQMGASLFERFGKIDILVLNASMLGDLSPLTHHKPKTWENVLKLNLTANYRLLRSLDALLRAAPSADVVFITDSIGTKPEAYWGPYAISKTGLETMAKIYQAETAKTNIKTHIFDPGKMATALRYHAFPGENQNTLPQADDVAEQIMDLLRPAALQHSA